MLRGDLHIRSLYISKWANSLNVLSYSIKQNNYFVWLLLYSITRYIEIIMWQSQVCSHQIDMMHMR